MNFNSHVFHTYWGVFRAGIQSTLIYRWNFSIRALFSLISLTASCVLWFAAYQNRDIIGGFTISQTLSYFFIALLISYMIAIFDEDTLISEEIRNGQINHWLLKPVNYFLIRMVTFAAKRCVTASVILIPAALCLFLLEDYTFVSFDPWHWWLFFCAFCLSFMIQFCMSFILATITFWMLDVRSILMLFFALSFFLSGQTMPLDLVPQPYYGIMMHLPFFYQLYFPASILCERIPESTIYYGLGVEVLWTLVLLWVPQILWKRGMLRFTAAGG